MCRRTACFRLAVWLWFLTCGLDGSARAEQSPTETLLAYIQAVHEGDWTAAASGWLADDLARADRLGIQYAGVPFKLDCASPLIGQDRRAEQEVILATKSMVGYQQITLGFIAQHDTLAVPYYLVKRDERWQLAAPTTAIGGSWPTRESPHLRFHFAPGLAINDVAMACLEDFVCRVGRTLELSPNQMTRLGRHKIDYYLCDQAAVTAIAGAPVRGVALLPVDAVATTEASHCHELAHLLVNYANGSLPLLTLPFLQEGLAVHLGGRWNGSARVMNELGRYILSDSLLTVDDLLPRDQFYRQMADLTYATSGVVTGALLAQMGPTDFLELYRELSGSASRLSRLNSATIRQTIIAQLGDSPLTIDQIVAQYASHSGGGIEPGLPDDLPAFLVINSPDATITISDNDGYFGFDIQTNGKYPGGALLLVPERVSAAPSVRASRLFTEQFPNMPYNRERMAIVITPGEVGLYDFGTDLLLSKYVTAFRPDERFHAATDHRWRFRIERQLLADTAADHRWEFRP